MCIPFVNNGCLTGGLSTLALNQLANAAKSGLTWVITEVAPLWLKLPSPDLTHEPAISAIGSWLLPLSAAVAVGGVIAAGARMAVTRRAAPLLDVVGGLITIAAVAALGVAVPNLMLQAGDAWSRWVLTTSAGPDFGKRIGELLGMATVPSALLILVFGLFAAVMVIVQGILLVFRQACVILLAALLPLAAAGSIAPMTRGWIRKIISWMLALICWKPAAAAVYAAAFTMIGKGDDIQSLLMGFTMLALTIIAFPVLTRFFTWTTGSLSSGSAGGTFIGVAAAGAVALSTRRNSAGAHAAYLSATNGAGPAGSASGAIGAATGAPANPAMPPSDAPRRPGAGSATTVTGVTPNAATGGGSDTSQRAGPTSTNSDPPLTAKGASPVNTPGSTAAEAPGGSASAPRAAAKSAAVSAGASMAAFMTAQALAKAAQGARESVTSATEEEGDQK